MSSKFSQILVLAFGLLAGVVIIINALSNPYSNSIGTLSRYLSIGLFAFGFFAKQTPFYFLIFLAAYSDLLKRLLVTGETLSRLDVTFVLMACPLLMAGMVANAFIQNLFSGAIFRKERFYALIIGAAFAAIMLLKLYGEGVRGMGLVRGAAVQGIFAFLPFVAITQFETAASFRPVIKFFVIVFIPVLLYALHQNIYGYLDFELIYRASGMSLKEQTAATRTPSTLSHANVVSFSAAIMFLLLVAYRKGAIEPGTNIRKKEPLFPLFFEIILVLTCLVTVYLVRVRGLYFFTAGVLPCFYAILSRGGTLKLYMFFGSLYLLLIFSAGYIVDSGLIDSWNDGPAVWLTELTNANPTTFRIATFVARLEGFRGMTSNPEYWTAFGQRDVDLSSTGMKSEFTSHDQVSRILLTGGFFGLGVVVFLTIATLYKLHKLVWAAPFKSRERYLSAFGLTVFLGSLGLSAAAGGGVLIAFPGPTLLFLSLSLTALAIRDGVRYHIAQTESERVEAEKGENAPPVLRAGRDISKPAVG